MGVTPDDFDEGVLLMRLTMSGEVFSHGFPLEKTIALTKSYGIGNFELWAGNCPAIDANCHVRLYRCRDIAAAKRAFQDNGIHVACVAFGGAFHQEIVDDRALYSRELVRAVEVAAEMGAEYVNHYLTRVAPMGPPEYALLDAYLSDALRRAEQLHITMVLENEAVDVTHTPENMLEILRHFDSPYFKTNFDATNYYQGGNEAFPYAYEALKGRIGYVHIKNGCIWAAERGHDEQWLGGPMTGCHQGRRIVYTPPTLGAVNIPGLLRRLQEDAYPGYFALEPHSTVENVIRYYEAAIPLLKELGCFQPQS